MFEFPIPMNNKSIDAIIFSQIHVLFLIELESTRAYTVRVAVVTDYYLAGFDFEWLVIKIGINNCIRIVGDS